MKLTLIFLFVAVLPAALFSQIQPEWTRIFNGNDDYFDKGVAVAMDPSGNVFVGGTTVSITNGAPDYVIIKYSSSGDQKWIYEYEGAGVYEDQLTAIATDSEGNVYATGGSYEGSSRNDFVTIMVTASGGFGWKSVYKGLNVDNDDAAADIAVGDDGFIYVTGSSAGYSSSMWTDLATLKLNSAGDTVWTRRLGDGGMGNDRATAIAVDQFGNIYVTGYYEADVTQRYNYITVKYRPNGDTAWVRTYNGTGSDEDRAYAIAVSVDGNVYITGTSWGTYLDDYATIKYDSNGVQKWVARYNGPINSYDKAYDLKLDNQGNAYVTGQSGGTGVNYDYCTIKYNNDGGEEWVARYNGPDNLDDIATSLALDASGNVYVTGYSYNPPSPYISTTDMVLVRYNNLGEEEWTSRFNGPGNDYDKGYAIASDLSGNVFVTGSTEYYGQQNEMDIFTAKYTAPTSVPDVLDHASFSVYPNPADNRLSIKYQGKIEDLIICDIVGRVMLSSFEISPGSEYSDIDISDLPDGMYFLVLRDGHQNHTVKFIKNKP